MCVFTKLVLENLSKSKDDQISSDGEIEFNDLGENAIVTSLCCNADIDTICTQAVTCWAEVMPRHRPDHIQTMQ